MASNNLSRSSMILPATHFDQPSFARSFSAGNETLNVYQMSEVFKEFFSKKCEKIFDRLFSNIL